MEKWKSPNTKDKRLKEVEYIPVTRGVEINPNHPNGVKYGCCWSFILRYLGVALQIDYKGTGNCQISIMNHADTFISSVYAPVLLHALLEPQKINTVGDDYLWIGAKPMLLFDINAGYSPKLEQYFPDPIMKSPYKSTRGTNMVIYLVRKADIENIKLY